MVNLTSSGASNSWSAFTVASLFYKKTKKNVQMCFLYGLKIGWKPFVFCRVLYLESSQGSLVGCIQKADEKPPKWRACTQGNFCTQIQPSHKYNMKQQQSIFDVVSNSNIFVWSQFHFLLKVWAQHSAAVSPTVMMSAHVRNLEEKKDQDSPLMLTTEPQTPLMCCCYLHRIVWPALSLRRYHLDLWSRSMCNNMAELNGNPLYVYTM